MRPEILYECVKTYIGTTKRGLSIHFMKGESYFTTARGSNVHLSNYDYTKHSLPYMSLDEFKHVSMDHLEKR